MPPDCVTPVNLLHLPSPTPPALLLAHDLSGNPVIGHTTATNLTGLLPEFRADAIVKLTPCFKIRDVVAAAPISLTRTHMAVMDILVQSADASLSVYAGRNRICGISVPGPSGHLSDGVDALFRVGEFWYRLSRFVHCVLVKDCLSAITAYLFANHGCRRLAPLYQELLNALSEGAEGQWDAFQRGVMALIRGDLETAGVERVVEDISAWETLLQSQFHLRRRHSRRLPYAPGTSVNALEDVAEISHGRDWISQIFLALHLLYEDYKLDTHKYAHLERLITLLASIASTLRATAFIDHYKRDFPHAFQDMPRGLDQRKSGYAYVPSIVQTLVDRIRGSLTRAYPIPAEGDECASEEIPKVFASWRRQSPFELSKRVNKYYEILYGTNSRDLSQERKSDLLLAEMTKDGFTKQDLNRLPLGVCLPLTDALFVGRTRPKLSVTMDSLALLNRHDLLETDYGRVGASENDEAFIAKTTAMLRLNSFVGRVEPAVSNSEMYGRNDEDGGKASERDLNKYDIEDSSRRHRFCDDRRIHEVTRILRSTDETVISPIVSKPSDQSAEFDLATELKQKLEFLVKKRLAAPVGRGAFNLRTFVPSDPTQPLFIPSLRTTGKLLGQKGARVTLAATDAELIQWGEFHNGVAAGLRIVAASSSDDLEMGHILSRTWIVNHRPDDTQGSPGHAGMLLALGLGGYLPALKKTDYYQYLLSRHELTSIGLMLGLSVCNVGSMDEKITKMLCLHIRSFNVAGFAVPDFHVSVNTQTAAVLGLGLLHKSSVEVGVIQGLMQELVYKPKPGDAIDNREALALAAGLGIGFVCLGKGSAINGAETEISDRLLVLANGGLSKLKDAANGIDSSRRTESDEAGVQGPLPLPESETSRIDERGKTNTDVASPGALLALALIYAKTNDTRLAERIQLPSTLYSLDRVKPIHVYLAVLTKALVMWDDIEAKEDWIAKSTPSLLHGVSSNGQVSPMNIHGKINLPSGLRDEDIDVDGLLQARAFAVTGTWTAIALRYAGTSDPKAMAIIKNGCIAFETAIRRRDDNDIHMQWVQMTCMCSAALSLSIVAAGSGDLEIFRMLRRLRKVSAPTINKSRYGFHLALHLAIGFLFLGGGCLTFGSSMDAIFGLLCATYPHFPCDVYDNQYHLQAFRHLYVLAVEPRCIETRDVDTGRSCSVDVKLIMQNGTSVKLRAPCIVPDANTVKQVIIASERYMPRIVKLNPPTPGRGWFSQTSKQIVFVKRRVGHLPYETDPKGSRSIFARTQPYSSPGTPLGRSADAVERDLASLYSADPDVLSFDRFYCRSETGDDNSVKRYEEALRECLVGDKTGALYHFLDVWRIGELLQRGCIDPVSAGSLRILNAYVGFDQNSDKSLLRPSLAASVLRQAVATFGNASIYGADDQIGWDEDQLFSSLPQG